ncbi:proteinase inhibitor I36 SMPI [Streptomyces sp. BA2]|nr:proteinase inhibitor I36 SMPI [Streptomyces sp. BA2]
MAWIRKVTLAVSAMAMAGGSLAATAAPAAAVGGCPSKKLCLYKYDDYKVLALTSTSTKACIRIRTGGLYEIRSYVNNLRVNAVVYKYIAGTTGYVVDGTIRPGGYSSDAGRDFGGYGQVCMGGVKPVEG